MSPILRAFLENEKAIKRYLARFRAGVQDTEDYLQETFVRGFAAEMKGEIIEAKAYLFQIAKSIALEGIRRKARSKVESLDDSGDPDLIVDDNEAAADAWLDGRRKLALFTRAVAHLPPQCQKAFMMRRVEGLKYKQIANRMNISVSAVEKHVAIGLLKCNAYLRDHGYEPSEFGAPPDNARSRTGVSGKNEDTQVMETDG